LWVSSISSQTLPTIIGRWISSGCIAGQSYYIGHYYFNDTDYEQSVDLYEDINCTSLNAVVFTTGDYSFGSYFPDIVPINSTEQSGLINESSVFDLNLQVGFRTITSISELGQLAIGFSLEECGFTQTIVQNQPTIVTNENCSSIGLWAPCPDGELTSVESTTFTDGPRLYFGSRPSYHNPCDLPRFPLLDLAYYIPDTNYVQPVSPPVNTPETSPSSSSSPSDSEQKTAGTIKSTILSLSLLLVLLLLVLIF